MADANIRSGTITAIEPQARHPDRLNIFIDGEFAIGLAASVALDSGVAVGQMLSEADARRIAETEEGHRATESALRLVSYRARSESEIRQRLAGKDFSGPSIDVAIAQMREWGYINDQEFARQWVASHESHRPRSTRLMKRELTGKGVDVETAERAVDDADIDDFRVALDLARKWMPRIEREDAQTQRRRMSGYLQRRGYGWDVVRRVLDETLSGQHE